MSKPSHQYDTVIKYITDGIKSNKFPITSKLPSENELSEQLGVSRVTVRKALATLKAEGYIESVQGSGSFVKMSQNEQFIPIIVSNADNSSRFLDIYNGIQAFLLKHNLNPMLSITNDDYKTELEHVKETYRKGFKRMIILPCESSENIAFFHKMKNDGCDIVFIDTVPHTLDCDCVTSCNFDGGYKITKHLINQGHRKIAITFTKNPEYSNTLSDRFSGYKTALADHGIAFDPSLVFFKSREKNNYDLAEYYISQNVNASAVFCTADCQALVFANTLSKLDKKIAVAGFDNIPASESNTPAITTVNQEFYSLGYYAAELLYNRMINPSTPITQRRLPVTLITRESTERKL